MTRTRLVQACLGAVVLVAALALPYIAGTYFISVVRLAMVMGLFALSINLLGGYGGMLSLGHAGIFGAAAYGVGYMAARQGAVHIQQIVVGLGVGLLVSALFALMSMRTSKVYFLMVTLALGQIVWGITYRSTPLGSENGLRGILRPDAVSSYWVYYYLCLSVLVASIGLIWVIKRSPFGLSLRGLAESPTRLRMLGYNPTLTRFYAFMLSGLFASIAGILYVYDQQFVSPSVVQFMSSSRGVLMVIVGGVGTLVGPVVGAFILIFVENIVSAYVERWWTLLGLIFIFTIMFAPKGIVGGISAAWNRYFPEAQHGGGVGKPPDGDQDREGAGMATSSPSPGSALTEDGNQTP